MHLSPGDETLPLYYGPTNKRSRQYWLRRVSSRTRCHAIKTLLRQRLPEKELGAFLKKNNTELKVVYRMVMKEYAVVPDALLKKTKELKKYFDISYEYVKTLKPKATKRSK